MPSLTRLGRRQFLPALLLLCHLPVAQPAWADTATLTTLFGVLKDADGVTAAPDGALWIMVYDQNNDGVFPGGLLTNGSLTNPEAARVAFGGRTLAEGDLIEGDRIVHLDSSNSVGGGTPGTPHNFFTLDLTAEVLTPGLKWAFYWFPALSTSDTEVPPGDFTLPPARFHAIMAGPFDFAAWIDTFFPGESDQAKVGFGADPDHDGLSNGVEAILASAPDISNPGLSGSSAGPETLVVSSHRSKQVPSDVSAVWQWSIDLANWHLSGESEGAISVTISHLVTDSSHPEYDIVQTTAAGSGGTVPVLFCRLIAIRSP